MQSQHGLNLGYVAFGLLVLLAVQIWVAASGVIVVDYSRFLGLLDEGAITRVTVTESRIEGDLAHPIEGKSRFATTRVEPGFAAELLSHDVEIAGASESNWLTTLLSWIAPLALLVLFWTFVFRRFAERQGMGGLINIGRSRAKVWVERDTGVTFEDVAGIDEAKAELREVVSFLKERDRFSRLGARVPRGILLVGPPGTGKTLLARAIAGEAAVPFFSISGSEFVEMFVGVGAARVRDLFEQARKAAPCIIFIDEFDALGRARGAIPGFGGSDEKEQTLNQLLAELDGFDPTAGIVLLAATNRPEILDPALTRSGRFDRQIVVDRPERKGRRDILAVHVRKIVTDPSLDLDAVAALTPGFTGADLANLVNEAAIVATRRGADAVTMSDMTEAVERVVAGAERHSRLLDPAERHRVAVHEIGHALVAAALPGADPVHKISIIPRGVGALGYTLQRPTEDRFLLTRTELEDRMAVLLAGRAAEAVVFGEVSTGAEDDLAKATDIARAMATRFGMGRTIGPVALEERRMRWLPSEGGTAGRDFSQGTARELDMDVRETLACATRRAQSVLEERSGDLRDGADLLLKRETITPEDFPPIARSPGPGRAKGCDPQPDSGPPIRTPQTMELVP
ncbi:ATP-dependent zinc metalloprotease FtsH [Jannaschia formosa]|uniref:ATP-dependent zinc metalloprotease FtsH n=1 Tax=Jannaschia formosa TaxID=2259592 RepID=UPI001FD82D64|nr:ATP-dependent zinc metalloprotease FtsH [Jannaschia formosa]